ncbi:hypothetical protein [Cupriavidus sp. Agwp_2]|uniref:hypothetical protein n=1 Tax=Cupriavidus sp. Agwp_2 TaxID=2897324 RepID=UPI00345FAE39
MLQTILKLFHARKASQAAAPATNQAADKPHKGRRKLRRGKHRAAAGAVHIDADGPLIEQARQVARGVRL